MALVPGRVVQLRSGQGTYLSATPSYQLAMKLPDRIGGGGGAEARFLVAAGCDCGSVQLVSALYRLPVVYAGGCALAQAPGAGADLQVLHVSPGVVSLRFACNGDPLSVCVSGPDGNTQQVPLLGEYSFFFVEPEVVEPYASANAPYPAAAPYSVGAYPVPLPAPAPPQLPPQSERQQLPACPSPGDEALVARILSLKVPDTPLPGEQEGAAAQLRKQQSDLLPSIRNLMQETPACTWQAQSQQLLPTVAQSVPQLQHSQSAVLEGGSSSVSSPFEAALPPTLHSLPPDVRAALLMLLLSQHGLKRPVTLLCRNDVPNSTLVVANVAMKTGELSSGTGSLPLAETGGVIFFQGVQKGLQGANGLADFELQGASHTWRLQLRFCHPVGNKNSHYSLKPVEGEPPPLRITALTQPPAGHCHFMAWSVALYS
eukprot:TRINITY_DN18898_c0_g1_i1.p1 TRINITY_DN18898_c0_g1~~TRINITY_DN18898_c0_g1_i1.p1  ORF type:complete len:429 (-),score=104.70 TRINITY_DN18898_c0_g1_i1:61-1347(-)